MHVLILLDQPFTINELSELASVDVNIIQKCINTLDALRLLYYSRGKYLSLVNHSAKLKEAFIPESFHYIV